MLKRVALTLFLLPAFAAVASAATIDADLREVLDSKAAGDMVRVLMLMDESIDVIALEATLAGTGWQERRQRVVAACKALAARSQAPAFAQLNVAKSGGGVRNLRSLWINNAIAFEGDRTAIEALAASDVRAVLIHDKPRDMISSVTAPRRQAGDEGTNPQALGGAKGLAWGVDWVNADDVWNTLGYDGAGIVVAHFDTGVWLTHPDIANRLWVNAGEIPGNLTDDDGNGYVDDVNGWDFGNQDSDPNDDVVGPASNHGTHTAGTVCGDGTNGTETGVAPGAEVMVCKAYLSDGSGASFSAIYEGQQYGIMMGARVFTMSLGVGCDLGTSHEYLMRTERQTGDVIRVAGVIFFNSAGNDRYNCNPPIEIGLTSRVPAPWNPITTTPYTSLGGVVAVGGMGYKNNNVYTLSSWGPVKWDDIEPWNDWPYSPGSGLTKPDVAAPGTNVNSLQKPSGYTGDTWSGTSMACPHAAGVAALMLEKNPSLSPYDIDRIMEQTATDLGTVGKDNTFGSGYINAFAAVSAVTTALTPHLIWTDITYDPSGDGVFDPGETADIVFELTNNSSIVDATGVTATLTVTGDPYVSVVDGNGSFGTITMNGGTGDNSGDVFTLNCTGGAPQGYEFMADLTVSAQNGYQRVFDVKMLVGLPHYRTHNVGAVSGTVTDQGAIGYMSSDQIEGDGFGLTGGGSGLYIGTLWAGTDLNYMCARGYPETPQEWEFSSSPNGRVRDLGAGTSDQDFQAIFTDAGHASSKPVVVTQNSYAWAAAPNDDFIMIKYVIRNDSGSTINNYYAGIFCDWDIGSYSTNEGGTDVTRRLAYMYSAGGVYYGVALLDPQTSANETLLKNETYVYPLGHVEDSMKDRHLKGIITTSTSDGPNDWSALTSAGPFTIAPGGEIEITFAMVRGDDLADLQSNTDAAQAINDLSPVAELIPVKVFGLDQNEPNPFNPSTSIKFTVAREGHVELSIYDLSGRKVRNLISGSYGVGEHSTSWDGRDDAGSQMPSGIYVYKYKNGERQMSRKMTLLK